MSLAENLQRLFRTKKWRLAETERIVRHYFQVYDPVAAAAVVDCIEEMLGVNFDQLQPQTDLEHDLGADEEMEYIEISLAFEETHGITIAPEEIYEAKTVGRLVELVTVLLAQKVNVP